MDKELKKIASLLKRFDELEGFFYANYEAFTDSEITRIRKYVANRKKYFIDWLLEQ